MLVRYRWYVVTLPNSRNSLNEILAGASRGADRNDWFVETQLADGSSGFRFYWVIPVSLTRINDGGEPSSVTVDSMGFIDFQVIEAGDSTLLRLINPSRNLRILISSLERIVGRGFTCEALSLDEFSASAVLRKVDDSKIVGFKVTNVVVGKDVVARMEFASKGGIKIEELKALRGVPHKVEHITYELVYRGLRGQLSYGSSGLVRIGGPLSPRIMTVLEKDLCRQVKVKARRRS